MTLRIKVREDEQTNPELFCEFWIKNCQFKVFYDLEKYFDKTDGDNQIYSLISPYTDVEQSENEGEQSPTNPGMNINDLPTEMVSRILYYLNPVELLQAQKVCQFWREIITQDKSIWNHLVFSAAHLDVKTTSNLIKEMPLLRSVELCNVHSSEDMTLLVTTLCHAVWNLQKVQFPRTCEWHPSTQDLYQLQYYHPRLEYLQLSTKQKLTPEDIANFGAVLEEFPYLKHLSLIGFYWYQTELVTKLLPNVGNLKSLRLPSFPGLTVNNVRTLLYYQPHLTHLQINTSSMQGKYLTLLKHIKSLHIIDSSTLTTEKFSSLGQLRVTTLDINLSNASKENAVGYFKSNRHLLKCLTVNNCEFSNELVECLSQGCPNIDECIWLNPKDALGELTDDGIPPITRLKFLARLEIKSRSLTKAVYPLLASMRSLRYARINGMRVPGCL